MSSSVDTDLVTHNGGTACPLCVEEKDANRLELAAIEVATTALFHLDSRQIRRVMTYLMDRFMTHETAL